MKYIIAALLISTNSFAATLCQKRHRKPVTFELKAPIPPLPCYVYMDGNEIYTATADKAYCHKMMAESINKYVRAGYDCSTQEDPTIGVKL